jgi:hypothetical protein
MQHCLTGISGSYLMVPGRKTLGRSWASELKVTSAIGCVWLPGVAQQKTKPATAAQRSSESVLKRLETITAFSCCSLKVTGFNFPSCLFKRDKQHQ